LANNVRTGKGVKSCSRTKQLRKAGVGNLLSIAAVTFAEDDLT
jgi:hypothetical protein